MNNNTDNPKEEEQDVSNVMPPEFIHRVELMSAMMMKDMSSQSNIADKLTAEHLDKMIDNEAKEIASKYKYNSFRLVLGLILFIFMAGLLITVIIILKDSPDVMEKIIYTVGGVIIGGIGGYGFGSRKSNNSSDDE